MPSFSIPAVIVGIEFAVFSASEMITKEMLGYQMLKWLLINVCISLCGIVVNLILSHSKLRETFWSWLSLNVGITLYTGLFSLAVYLIF